MMHLHHIDTATHCETIETKHDPAAAFLSGKEGMRSTSAAAAAFPDAHQLGR
jgi:hypothetical protein